MDGEIKLPERRISEILGEIAGQFCDGYCKWPEQYTTEGELYDKHCNKCPVNLLA